jgi:hypothetical protein
VEPSRQNPTEIPACIVYANTKMECAQIAGQLRKLLPAEFHRKPAGPFQVGSDVRMEGERIISTFYSTLDQTTKTIIHNDMLAGRTRILVSSEAYGLGMDVDVVRVVQWGVAKVDSMDTVVQRFGRAGRDFNKQAMAVLYVEPSYFNDSAAIADKEGPGEPMEDSQLPKASKGRRNAAAMLATKDPTLIEFINPPDGGCRRKVLLRAYSDPLLEASEGSAELASGPCCDVDGDIDGYPCGIGCAQIESDMDNLDTEQPSRSSFPTSSAAIKEQVQTKLVEFRRRIFKRDWEAYDTEGMSTDALVLTDKHITMLAKNCTKYPTVDDLKLLRGFKWVHMEKYGMCVNSTDQIPLLTLI